MSEWEDYNEPQIGIGSIQQLTVTNYRKVPPSNPIGFNLKAKHHEQRNVGIGHPRVRPDGNLDAGRTVMNIEERYMNLSKQAAAREAQSRINEATHGSHLVTNSKARKETPICTGVLDYFPKALAEVSRLSKAGNDKHNPGEPLHWAREKSTDHADCIVRHLIDRGSVDEFGFLHEASVAWRALALLELAIEKQMNEGKN